MGIMAAETTMAGMARMAEWTVFIAIGIARVVTATEGVGDKAAVEPITMIQ